MPDGQKTRQDLGEGRVRGGALREIYPSEPGLGDVKTRDEDGDDVPGKNGDEE